MRAQKFTSVTYLLTLAFLQLKVRNDLLYLLRIKQADFVFYSCNKVTVSFTVASVHSLCFQATFNQILQQTRSIPNVHLSEFSFDICWILPFQKCCTFTAIISLSLSIDVASCFYQLSSRFFSFHFVPTPTQWTSVKLSQVDVETLPRPLGTTFLSPAALHHLEAPAVHASGEPVFIVEA
jgi:hypothetical protein